MHTFSILITVMGCLVSFAAGILTSNQPDAVSPFHGFFKDHPILCIRLPIALVIAAHVWYIFLVPAIMLALRLIVHLMPPVVIRALRRNLSAIGFTPNGITSGSYAACWQSGWYGGRTPRSSLFAKLNMFTMSLYINGHNSGTHTSK